MKQQLCGMDFADRLSAVPFTHLLFFLMILREGDALKYLRIRGDLYIESLGAVLDSVTVDGAIYKLLDFNKVGNDV
ncbi:hypothetical protein P8V03_13820 [Clostridium sp. A1-XYC3]|uniref:Uncharacterized protein n=1 Tax=Clostridium tanneri TaxID=3037988 RepID=A0ABU4JVP2_9CLOT|nr:hypothetical protein [Clostridium sp. A1-XYC3]MDW8802228.1 hypothetical protein [Clostridium sp. A1-XYC3]